MSAHSRKTGIVESATLSANRYMTKEECRQKSDDELLAMAKKAKGHTSNDFSKFMKCDFSYNFLTTLLKDRDHECSWHKILSDDSLSKVTPTVIKMKKTENETIRQSFMIEKSIADEWKSFNKDVPFNTVTIGAAFRRFMDDYRSGRIKFELDI